MYGKFKTRLDAFWHSYIPQFLLLKIGFLVPKVSNSWIFQMRCFLKIIWHRISVQTLLLQTCLPTRQNGVENRDKAYCNRRKQRQRPIRIRSKTMQMVSTAGKCVRANHNCFSVLLLIGLESGSSFGNQSQSVEKLNQSKSEIYLRRRSIRAVFSILCRMQLHVCFGLALLSVIGWQNSSLFPNQWEAKPKTNRDLLARVFLLFSRAWDLLRVFASNSHKLIALFASVVIG